MSLLDEAFEPLVVMNKITESDGLGGVTTRWVEGATIYGAFQLNNSAQTQIAQQLGATSAYTITFRKNVTLDYHDVLKRVADGKYFRLTSNTDDLATPKSAALNMRNYTAEEWVLP